MRPSFICAMALGFVGSLGTSGFADLIVNFSVDSNSGGSIVGNVFTFDSSVLNADGVNFTARLTVSGSGATVGNNTNGLGVDGSTINAGESLTFAVSILSQSGGTVAFNGFTQVDFNSYTSNGGDSGRLNALALGNRDLDLFDLSVAPFNTPEALQIQGSNPFPGGTTSFQIDDVTLSFRGTAVPEPGCTTVLLLALAPCLYRRKGSLSRRLPASSHLEE